MSQATNDNALLYMWADKSQLTKAIVLMHKNGFENVDCSVFVRNKTEKGGKYFQDMHKMVLVGKKGDVIFRESTPEGIEFISIMFEMKNEMDTTAGAHLGKGLPSKTTLVETLYGLDRYHREQIEKADEAWLRKAIKYAVKHNSPVKCATMIRLKNEEEKARKVAERKKLKEVQTAEFAAKVENAKKASLDEEFSTALVDMTLAPEDFDFATVSLPMAEDSPILIAVKPKDMIKALDILNLWQYSYVDNVIWNRDFSKPGSF